MVEVLLNWLIFFITSYVIGYTFVMMLCKLLGIRHIKNSISSGAVICIFTGLGLINAYAEYFSLFFSVSMWANLILLIVSIGLSIYLYKNVWKNIDINNYVNRCKAKKIILNLFLILIMAYGTSRGYMHYDTNLYHAQAIRWIEEYGVVPGLANLQSRFGYNSAEFSLNAIFSYKWLLGRSLHTSAGFFALLSTLIMVDISHIWTDWKENRVLNIWLSDFVRVGLLYYLFVIYGEMISPASDYYAQLLIFDVVIIMLDLIELSRKEAILKADEMGIMSILCLLIVYAVTIKLSIGLLVLLALIPGLYLVRQGKTKAVWGLISSGLFIAIPYFIRNHIISGWILYPSTVLSFGHPIWQIPKGEAMYDAKEIGMWGRGITQAKDWDKVKGFNWISDWIHSQSNVDKMWIVTSFIALLLIVLLIMYSLLKKKYMEVNLFIMLVLAICTVFWFVSAPLVRYGYAYLIILPLLCLGYVFCELLPDCRIVGIYVKNFAILFSCMLVLLIKSKGMIAGIYQSMDYNYYIRQQDYIDGDAHTYEIDGVTVYVADDAGQIGYYKFPSSVEEKTNLKLIGHGLANGFSRK